MGGKREKKVYFVGVKGVAMSGLALILKKQGCQVAGSDVKESFITSKVLDQIGLKPLIGFKQKNISRDTDLVVYSASHRGRQNVEVREAIRKGIPVISEAGLIAELTRQEKVAVAVAGCHGKTTTASLLAFSLIKLGQKPSYLVGTSSFNNFFAADYNRGRRGYFVVEADEYAIDPSRERQAKFSLLNPRKIILTNIDYDHVDIYPNIEAVKREFGNLIKKIVKTKGKLIFNRDDPNSLSLAEILPKQQRLSYGFSPDSDLQILNDWQTTSHGSVFKLVFRRKDIGQFKIGLFGEKNVLNAAAVILFLLSEGFSVEKIKMAIKDFTGAKRRFEKIYEKNGSYLFDDYGHHPREIRATIEAARARFPHKKLLVIFQPHTYSRTAQFKNDFARVLSKADRAIILPIFSSARERKDNFSVSAENIAERARCLGKNDVVAVADKKELLLLLTHFKNKKNWLIFTMGAGNVYELRDDIIKAVWST